MASGIYNRLKANLMKKQVDLEGDTIKVMLLDEEHGFNAAHNGISEVSDNEIEGTGYAAGGAELTGMAVTQGETTVWAGDNVEWGDPEGTLATFDAAHAVLWDDTADDNLITSIDFGGTERVIAGVFTIAWDEAGIIAIA